MSLEQKWAILVEENFNLSRPWVEAFQSCGLQFDYLISSASDPVLRAETAFYLGSGWPLEKILSESSSASVPHFNFDYDNAYLLDCILERYPVDILLIVSNDFLRLNAIYRTRQLSVKLEEVNLESPTIKARILENADNEGYVLLCRPFETDLELINNREGVAKDIVRTLSADNIHLNTSSESFSENQRFWEKFLIIKDKSTTESEDFHSSRLREIASYVKTFAKLLPSAPYIEMAKESFLACLPEDAQTVVDIGCGPGVFSRIIPSSRKVLGIDLDARILKNFPGASYVGTITDIPLKDQSTDLILCCDVLEHLESRDLNAAVSELGRVAKKYLYIQVPNNENLEWGLLQCANCKFEWHINFHKRSFTPRKLINLFSKDWKPRVVNLTGECTTSNYTPNSYSQFFKENQRPWLCDAAVPCPKCGSTSRPADDASMQLKAIKHWNEKLPAENYNPKFSEIAILFERLDEKKNDALSTPREEKIRIEGSPRHGFDFKKPFIATKDINRFETIRHVNCVNGALSRSLQGLTILPSTLAPSCSLYINFRGLKKQIRILKINGDAYGKMKIYVSVGHYLTGEKIIINENIDGKFSVSAEIENSEDIEYVFRISWKEKICLRLGEISFEARDISEDQVEYDYPLFLNSNMNSTFIPTSIDGINCRLFLPRGEQINFSHPLDKFCQSVLGI